jgi:hypothetical protein
VVSSPAEHYPCTRRLAIAARAQDGSLQGLIWHSRHTELAGHPATEVLVLFGDSFPSGRGSWPLTGHARPPTYLVERHVHYLLTVKGNQPELRRVANTLE